MKHATHWMVLLALVLSSIGCATSRPQSYDIVVSMDDAMGPTSVAVDLIAANESLAETLAQVPVSEYFTPGNKVREGLERHTFRFVPNDRSPRMLGRDEPVWDTWKARGATQLFVMANLLGSFEDRPGAADNRRLILPLARDRWDDRTIRIVVREGFLDLVSPPKPPK